MPKRVLIETPITALEPLKRVWNIVLLSYILDALLIAFEFSLSRLPAFLLNAELLMIALLSYSAIIWKQQVFESAFNLQSKITEIKNKKIIQFIATIVVALPLIEIILRAGFAGAAPLLIVALIIMYGLFIMVRSGKSLMQTHTPLPRNLILRSPNAHTKNVLLYISGVFAARTTGILALVLYISGIIPLEDFLIFEFASFAILFALAPTPQRFFSICPQCRQYRARSISLLGFCPACSRKKFYRFTTYLFVLVPCLLSGCVRTESQLTEHTPSHNFHSRSAIIFVPGFKGSSLFDTKTGETVWVTAGHATFNRSSLARKIEGIHFNFEPLELRVKDILTEVPVIPGIYSYDAYASTLQSLKKYFYPTPIIPFAYDWRQDLSASAADLAALIERLKNNDIDDIHIIAHSMGGLIAAYYLRYGEQPLETAIETWSGAQRVRTVVFAGTPFRGAITICNDLQEGIQTFLNDSLLSQESLSTFPAAYQLMPGSDTSVYLDPNMDKISGIMHDPESWIKFQWGLLKDTSTANSDYETRIRFTKAMLIRADLFSKKILSPRILQSSHKIRIINIYGDSHPTMTHGIFDTENLQFAFTKDQFFLKNRSPDLLQTPGDLVVPSQSAFLPTAYKEISDSQDFVFDVDHGEVISSKKTLNTIKQQLEISNRSYAQK